MSFPGRSLQQCWHLVDAKGQTVGRLAQQVASILRGKHKPTFHPAHDMGDTVVVINADAVKFSADKMKTKLYRWHTGYPGGLKERRASEMMERRPDFILRKAIIGMLRKTPLRKKAIEPRLKIYTGDSHPHEAQLGGVPPIPRVPEKLNGSFHFGLDYYAHPKSYMAGRTSVSGKKSGEEKTSL